MSGLAHAYDAPFRFSPSVLRIAFQATGALPATTELPIQAKGSFIFGKRYWPSAIISSRSRLGSRPALGGWILDAQSKQRTQASPDNAADKCRNDPAPAMQAAGGDSTKVRADIASVGEPGAVAQQQ